MLSSSKNCMFIFKSQAAVRSRALGFTGEGAYNETYNHNKRKTCNRNGHEAGEREFPSKQALSHAAQTATNKPELPECSGQGGRNSSCSAPRIILGQKGRILPCATPTGQTHNGTLQWGPAESNRAGFWAGPVTSAGHGPRSAELQANGGA